MITSIEIAHLLAKKGHQNKKGKNGFDSAILGLGVGAKNKSKSTKTN